MQGLLVWKHATAGSAIIWCEDGQVLAFASDLAAILTGPMPEPGDLLEVSCTRGTPRHCRRVRLIRRAVWPGLAADLLSAHWVPKPPPSPRPRLPSGNAANLDAPPQGGQRPSTGWGV